jgi:hypothetical protein
VLFCWCETEQATIPLAAANGTDDPCCIKRNEVKAVPEEPSTQKLLVSLNVAATMLGIGRSTLLTIPELESVYIGKRHLITTASINHVVKNGSGSRYRKLTPKSPGRPRKADLALIDQMNTSE